MHSPAQEMDNGGFLKRLQELRTQLSATCTLVFKHKSDHQQVKSGSGGTKNPAQQLPHSEFQRLLSIRDVKWPKLDAGST